MSAFLPRPAEQPHNIGTYLNNQSFKMHNTETVKRRANGRLPVGYRRVRREGGWVVEPDPEKELGMRLAVALAATGKMSVREISKEIVKYGIVGQDGKALRPGTLWRLLRDRTRTTLAIRGGSGSA